MASGSFNYNVTYQSAQQTVESPENAIFIDNSPAAGDLLQIAVTSVSGGQPITLQGQGSASKDSYHFKVYFSAGELAQPDGIALAADQVNDWDAHVVDDGANGTTIYVLRKGTLKLAPDSPFTVTLQKVGARSKAGPRSTIVRFTWADDIAATDPNGLGSQDPAIQIINFERKSVPPLSVGFDTTDMVLCDGEYQNVLVLGIVNLSSFPIALDPDQCKLTLCFDTSTDTSQRWALATPDQAKAFCLPGKLDGPGVDNGWPVQSGWNVKPVADPQGWQLTPTPANKELAAGSSLEIPISNIITAHPTGRSLLRVHYQGFQEYAEGKFTVEIQKTPLIYWGTGSRVQGLGVSHINGTAELRTWVNNSQGGLGTFSDHPLQLYTNSKPQLTLTADGKLGIGTSTPMATLDVRGDAAVSGSLGIGTTEPIAKLDVRGNTALGGNATVGGIATVCGLLNFEWQGPRQLIAMGDIALPDHAYGIGVQRDTLYLRSNSDFAFYSEGTHSNTPLDPGNGGTAPMVIKGNGQILINDQSPMVIKYYTLLGDCPRLETGMSSRDWFACIVGFTTKELGAITGLLNVWTEDDGKQWILTPSVPGPANTVWSLMVLFVRKELCTIQQ